jgi:hypothetical protein
MIAICALSISSSYAADDSITFRGGKAHSSGGDKYVVIMNIGKKGNVFAGTFIGRSAYYAWDFIMGVYTDKESRLSIVPISSETPLLVNCTNLQNCKITTSSNTEIGNIKYNPDTGDLSISGTGKIWFQGELMGSYMEII